MKYDLGVLACCTTLPGITLLAVVTHAGVLFGKDGSGLTLWHLSKHILFSFIVIILCSEFAKVRPIGIMKFSAEEHQYVSDDPLTVLLNLDCKMAKE